MNRLFGRIRFKQRIFLYLIITMTIPVVTLGYFSYQTYIDAVTKEVHSSVNETLTQFKLRTDNTVNYLKKYYIEAADSDEVNWLINTRISNSDYSKLVEAQNVLSCSAYLSEYITGYTFINNSSQKVLSNRGMYDYELVTNKAQVEALMDNETGWVNNTSLSSTNTLRREMVDLSGVLYYQNLPLTRKEKSSLMIVNIDLSKLNESVSTIYDSSELIIFDRRKQLVYTSNEGVANKIIQKNQLDELGEFSTITTKDGTSYMVSTVSSDIVDWTYAVAWNLDTAQSGGGTILWMTVAILLIGGVFLVLIWLFANRLYSPVAKLMNYASIAANNDEAEEVMLDSDLIKREQKDDFKRITGNIDCLVDRNSALKDQLAAQEAQLSEFFLSRLISGNLKPDQIDFYLNKLRLTKYHYYVVMAVGLQNNLEATFNEARQDALRLEVTEQIPKEIRETFMMEPSCNVKVITIVLGADDLIALDSKIIEVYKGLDIYVQEGYDFPVKVGVSSSNSDLKNFRNAHNEALEALKNNEVLHQGSKSLDFEGVTFYSDIKARENEAHPYDRLIEKEIRDAVDDCDQVKAFELVDTFVNELTTHNVAVVERQFYLQRYMNEILMVPLEAGISVDLIFREGVRNIFQSMNQIYDSDKLKQFYRYTIIEPIIAYLKEHRTSKSAQIIKEILDIIEVRSGDITLAECADELGYHSTYIWKVMKAERNITFSEYIAKYKINQAKELLLQTILTVNEISVRLNYTNAQNFIRFFNKNVGTTPGKYRSANKVK